MPAFPSGPSRLAALIIDSATLLVPPAIDWFLGALHRALITQLGLAMPSADHHTWGAVLPRIAAAAPYITFLVFTEVVAPIQPVVLSVLNKFAKLKVLQISHLHPRPLSEPIAPYVAWPALRNVTVLRVPITVAEHILAPADSLPELLALSILWCAPRGLNLWLFFVLLRSFSAKLDKRKTMPRLMIDINARAGFTADDVVLPSDLASSNSLTVVRARVEQLHIDLHYGKPVDAQGIARLVALFPRLEVVGLTSRRAMNASAITRVLGEGRATASLKEMDLEGKAYRVEE